MVILLFGPPGCGKGTQASSISRLLGIPAISTGEMFRAERAAGTALGEKVSGILAQGGLVGDEIVNEVVASRLGKADCRGGFLLDGYPRTIAQAEYLDELLKTLGCPAPAILHLDVPDAALVSRLTARRQCPACGRIYNLLHQPPRTEGICDEDGKPLVHRVDDNEEVIRMRLAAYHEQTGPLLKYYSSGDFHRIEGDRPPREVLGSIEAILEPAHATGSRK